jgi:hypothetical protein
MKKLNLILGAIVILLTVLASSCTPYAYGTYGVYDENDSYFIYGTPYYHRQHYYNDYYYDRSSQYYNRQHYYRNENRPTDSRTNVYKGNNNVRSDRSLNNNNRNNNTNVSKSKRSNNKDTRRSKEKEIK